MMDAVTSFLTYTVMQDLDVGACVDLAGPSFEECSSDWRLNCRDILAAQNKARIEGRFTDVQFFIQQGESKVVFNAHKAILACASPVFEKMFYGPLAETKNVIEVFDDPEAFEMLLNSVYGQKVHFMTFNVAAKCYIIGDKYLVPKMKQSATTYIRQKEFMEEDFWYCIIVEKNAAFCPPLNEKILFYISEYTTRIVTSEKFIIMPEGIVYYILENDAINVKESSLLFAITNWGYENIKDVDSEKLKDLYKFIIFHDLELRDMFTFIQKYPHALDKEDSLAILQHLNNHELQLPEWCSKKFIPRWKNFRELKF